MEVPTYINIDSCIFSHCLSTKLFPLDITLYVNRHSEGFSHPVHAVTKPEKQQYLSGCGWTYKPKHGIKIAIIVNKTNIKNIIDL